LSSPPSSTDTFSKPKDLSIHQKRVAHIAVPMLYSTTRLFVAMPWRPNAASSCVIAGIVKRSSVLGSENSPCKSRKSALGICPASKVCRPGTAI
jgi:hypothetical protein